MKNTHKLGILLIVIAGMIVGGMENGDITFMLGACLGIICAVASLVLLWE
jgi:hypothetical protein